MYDLNIDGFMEQRELIQIEKWASEVPNNGVIVEVGSYKGRSSYAWAASCDPSVTVYCMDGFDPTFYDIFKENMKDFSNVVQLPSIVPYQMPGWTDQPIDIFFLDAAHTNPEDIDAINYFLPLIKKGGLICGHDYYPDRDYCPDIISNVKELESRLGQEVINPDGTSIWAFRV